MLDQLSSFLRVDQILKPMWQNKEGHGSATARILNSIGESNTHINSDEVVDEFLYRHSIEEHEGCLTFFEKKGFLLSRSNADKALIVFHF